MKLARVVGPVWGARHAPSLGGVKLLEVEPFPIVDQSILGGRTGGGPTVVAVDALGAGPGEWVLVAHGSRVRDLTVGPAIADKDIVIAIVDGADLPAAYRGGGRP